MPSSLIDIADWIDRFGMDLLDAEIAAARDGASAAATPRPGANGAGSRRVRTTLVVEAAHERIERLH